MTCCEDQANHREDHDTGVVECVSCGACVSSSPDAMERLLATLGDVEPNAIMFEPRSVWDQAIVGLTNHPRDRWQRPTPSPWVVVYDLELAIEALAAHYCEGDTTQEAQDAARRDAEEWISYNSMGAWLGAWTPTFADLGAP